MQSSDVSCSPFWPAGSYVTKYIEFFKDIGCLKNKEKDTTKKKILLRVVRLIATIITVPIFTKLAIFYNTIGIAMKGSLAILTNALQKPIFQHPHKNYRQDLNKHIAYAMKDLVYNFFTPSLCLIYTLDPELLGIIDQSLNRLIEYIAL